MKIYIKYLFINLIKYFILVLFISTLVIWITRVTRYINYITEYGTSLRNFLIIIFNILPSLLTLTIPLSSFITVIFLYNKLIKNNELIIFQNAGLKKRQLLLPVFFMSLIALLFLYYLTFSLLRISNVKFNETKMELKNDAVKVLFNNTNFNTFKNITIYSREKKDNIMYSLMLYIKAKNNNEYNRIIYATQGEIINTYIFLSNGNIQEWKNNDKKLKTIYFDKYTVDVTDYYDINTNTNTDKNLDLKTFSEILKIENKSSLVIAEIANRLLTPILPISLSILAGLLILNSSFKRGENNKYISFIYTICIVNCSLFIFFIRLAKKNNLNIIICVLCLMTPLFYLMIRSIKNIVNKFSKQNV